MKRLAPVPVPTGVVTVTLCNPAVPAGVMQVIVVSLTITRPVTAAPPIVAPVAPVKCDPVIVTAVPPVLEPLVGEIEVTEGGNGAMVFTLTGPGYFPSAAYVPISTSGTASAIRLAAKGVRPDDGFACYPPFGPPCRWGDYSWAVTANNSVWIATEYIGPKVRDKFTNWGTFIGSLPLP